MTVQSNTETEDSDYAGSRKTQSPALRSSRLRRFLPLRKARYSGSALPVHGSPFQVITIDSDSDSDDAGVVPLLEHDSVIDDGNEDGSMPSISRPGKGSDVEGRMELSLNSTGPSNSKTVRSRKANKWLLRVEGASR